MMYLWTLTIADDLSIRSWSAELGHGKILGMDERLYFRTFNLAEVKMLDTMLDQKRSSGCWPTPQQLDSNLKIKMHLMSLRTDVIKVFDQFNKHKNGKTNIQQYY